MGARTTLNGIYVTICLAVAVFFGGVTGSWVVFTISAAALIGAKIHSGAIRPSRRRK